MTFVNLGEIHYISNLLSLSRIFLLIPLYLSLKLETTVGNYLAFFVMLLIAATDFWDGYLARKLNQKSDLGRILDPIADKVCVAVAGFLLITLRDLPVWYFLLLIGRDLAILILGLFVVYKTKAVVESNWIGKVAVTGVAVVLIAFTLELEPVKLPFLWISVGLVVASSLSYFWKFYRTVFSNKKQLA
ncbi:CDP-alcohol phosphatidyltransferase family protein [candidate division KSB1 bacterium]|nr:CDP-alcohol phosphatidyltransferase family protein [candidate division KSB1 bacterium]NIR72146.1 CDP-alcohol phosphatidyltransferase family protein [candidate division KSB1 bacterium]NIS26611.1 CDP-alcohol phosphatidyltransferase family protein [candidate division KSB1 bacterium]NIT73379.1 CDP-alcohol phosphatidyltransferase family protein [candidate division KSB1 bacterium]NIU27227.1 CDP-alcohol phosphatidyltransferase family protein [candidate division KSB1 bacterium]